MAEVTAGLRFASAVSQAALPERAIDEVVERLRQQMTGAADLVMAFATPHYTDHMYRIHVALAEALGPRVLLGTTAAGVIGTGLEIENTPGLSVLAAAMPGANLREFRYDQARDGLLLDNPDWIGDSLTPAPETPPPEATEVFTEAAREAVTGQGDWPAALILLADPFSVPITKWMAAVGERLPGVPVLGGMASAGREPTENRLLLDGQVFRDGAVGLAIGGQVRVDCTVSQGCRPFGRPMVITKSQRHLVQELGGRPALEMIREQVEGLPLADRDLLARRGLLVGRVIDEYKPRFGRGDFLIRQVVGVDEQAGYLAIGDAQVRMGQTIQFHLHDRTTAREDFELLLAAQKLHGPAEGALLVSCNGRGKGFFEEADADAELVRAALGEVPLAGFFASGELGPVGGKSFVHGHTASLAVFRAG